MAGGADKAVKQSWKQKRQLLVTDCHEAKGGGQAPSKQGNVQGGLQACAHVMGGQQQGARMTKHTHAHTPPPTTTHKLPPPHLRKGCRRLIGCQVNGRGRKHA